MNSMKGILPYLQRGVIALVMVLALISLGRMHVRNHQQQERIEQLEEGLLALNNRLDQIQNRSTRSSEQGTGQQRAYGKQKDASPNDKAGSSKEKTQDAASGKSRATDKQEETVRPESDSLRPKPLPIEIEEGSVRHKYTEPQRFNLNHIDSLTLIRIPGIAARTASTILKYRNLYGGFYDPWQLQEFLTWDAAQAYMPEWCTKWFTADVSNVKLIPLNKATVAELRRHPYITYEQAIDLVNYRTRHKRIEKIEELYNLSTFKPEEVKRVSFYLSFE